MNADLKNTDDLDYITKSAKAKTDIQHIYEFLGCQTSQKWLDIAKNHLPLLLQDHANCEKKGSRNGNELDFSL